MIIKRYRTGLFCLMVLCCCSITSGKPPNIVIILADDMGTGDVHAFNSGSRIPTPNLDRLAAGGMRFTDAHSGSAVCTPTRYGLITGRYCWRSEKKRGVLNGFSPHLIDPDRLTIADVAKGKGYRTACIGKWHLGMDLPMLGKDQVDFSGEIGNSPNVYGFDYFFGITASLDFPPYVFIENNRFTESETVTHPKSDFPAYLREGPAGRDFKHIQALDRLTEKAAGFIREQIKADIPFFLYFPLTAPHKPVMPAPRFQGRSGLGPYGDFVMQTDWTVGQVMKALEDAQATDDTLVIFSSDNASYMYRQEGRDHLDDPGIQGYNPENHQSNYVYRGTKADVWEGGHRVPFIARWPGTIKPGSSDSTTICLTDLMATVADITATELPQDAAEDSFSILPLLTGREDHIREPVINHSSAGIFAIRDGNWKLVLGNGSGGRQDPKGKPFEGPYQLFNLESDASEKTDVAHSCPEVVSRMLRQFDALFERTEEPVEHPAN